MFYGISDTSTPEMREWADGPTVKITTVDITGKDPLRTFVCTPTWQTKETGPGWRVELDGEYLGFIPGREYPHPEQCLRKLQDFFDYSE